MLLLPPLYNPIRPPSDCCTHDFICAHYTNHATSAMTLLGLTLSFYGRIDNPPHQSPYNDDFISLHPHPPSPLSLSLLSLTYRHSIYSVPVVPHLIRHTCLPPYLPSFRFFHPHHTVSMPPLLSSSLCVSYAALVTSFSINPALIFNIFLQQYYFPICSPCSALLALIYFY